MDRVCYNVAAATIPERSNAYAFKQIKALSERLNRTHTSATATVAREKHSEKSFRYF